MNDGGMGSLRLLVDGHWRHVPGKLIRIASELQFADADGVAVLASLFTAADHVPIELDIWKTDYSSLISVPSPLPPATRTERPVR